jgi:Nif-specific regulatory protein/two-component system response regulator HydG
MNDGHAALLEIAKLVLSEEDPEKTPEILLSRLLELTGASRGFIVIRDGDSFEQKFDVHFDRNTLSREERQFSRSLVLESIETRRILDSPALSLDPRFAEAKSLQLLGTAWVVVAPLQHGEVFGVVYLERTRPPENLDELRQLLGEFSEVAGLFLKRAIEREALRRRAQSLERDLFAQHDFEGIVTRDPKMLQLLKVVAQVADSSAAVLIRGETGTGKELVARALHLNSGRRHRPFVTLHCTALPGTILESELFGHVRGAFTGADRDRPGRIAAAQGGTLLLDEVAEIPADVQAKLLRFLQFGEIQRLGSDRTERVDVRVVAATHRDLASLIEAGRFRQDLYFRLKVVELFLPPLRERKGDIPLLAQHLLRTHWKRSAEGARFTSRAQQALAAYHYPGNVRELAHLVERACLLATEPVLDIDALPPEVAVSDGGLPAPLRDFTLDELQRLRESLVEQAEREFLTGLLARCGGNVSEAARRSGMQRRHLQKLLAKHRPK